MACALLAWQSVAAQTPLSRVAGPAIELRPGLVITQSARVVRRAYRLRANPSADSALIVIRGDNITVDFNGAELLGSPRGADPDDAARRVFTRCTRSAMMSSGSGWMAC